jgi:hypothetical protein
MRLASFASTGSGSDFNPVMALIVFGSLGAMIWGGLKFITYTYGTVEVIENFDSDFMDESGPIPSSGGPVPTVRPVAVGDRAGEAEALRPIIDPSLIISGLAADGVLDVDNFKCVVEPDRFDLSIYEFYILDSNHFFIISAGYEFSCENW